MAARPILHVITGLDRGGAEAVLARLAAHGDRGRFPSLVVSLTGEGVYGAALRAAGVTVIALGMKRGRPTLGGLLRLRRLIARERPALVLSWLYHADLAALLATRGLGVRLAWNLRCSAMDLGEYGTQVRLVRRLLATVSRVPDAVLVNSEAGRAFHESIGYRPRRWCLVPNGFDLERFRPDPGQRAAWRQRLGVGADAPLIGMVARVDPMKDHATFLAAAEKISAARPDAKFLLVGAGTERLALPAGLSGRIHALGERDDVPEILPALDLLLLTSAFGEGFANAVGEAMACGVPVVATDIGDARTVIGDTGMVTPPRDAAALAGAVLELLADPLRRRQLGDAARRRIAERYSLAKMVAAYERSFAELAE